MSDPWGTPANLRREKVKVYAVHWDCQCGGEMVPTGMVLTVHPPLYPHTCDQCGRSANAGRTYPYTDYE